MTSLHFFFFFFLVKKQKKKVAGRKINFIFIKSEKEPTKCLRNYCTENLHKLCFWKTFNFVSLRKLSIRNDFINVVCFLL